MPTATAPRQLVTFGNAGTHNQGVFASTPAFREQSPVVLLGNLQWNRYALNGTDLQLTRRLTGQTATLLRNVIGFRVQYGVSNVGSPSLDDWVHVTEGSWNTIDNANIDRVRAVRIGVVMRSPQREKPEGSNGECLTSTAKPRLFDGADSVEIEPDVADWQCYRYRSAIVIAPLRNLISGTATINWPVTVLQ
nr:PilW family protein [Aquabacterium terrae]